MATDITICSNALMRLGAKKFDSFSQADPAGENNEQVRLCQELWATVRRQVLRANTWNCALKRVSITADVTAPAFGYAKRYAKPADWLRTVFVGLDPADRYDYRTEGGFFLTDETSFPLLYVYDNTDPLTYDAALVEALEIAMAAALAYPVTQSTSLAAELTNILQRVLIQARGLDTGDDPGETVGNFHFRSSRFGNR
jgi:hypothetical protein